MITENYIKLFESSFKTNWDKEALCDYTTDSTMTYAQMCIAIARLHIVLERMGIKQGDKVAISGKNSSYWAVSCLAALTYGCCTVPILDEFTAADMTHILNHSESKILFCDNDIYKRLNNNDLPQLKGVISLSSRKPLHQPEGGELKRVMASVNAIFRTRYPNGYKPENIEYAKRDNSEIAILSYTSGTTSLTKGVLLSGNSIASNILFAYNTYNGNGMPLKSTLCVLPMAHSYAITFSLFAQMVSGAKVTMLGRIPSPNIVTEACQKISPTILCFVPLVIEKIYKLKILPLIKKPIVAWALRSPILGDVIHRAIGRRMIKLFGGVNEIIVGGAAVSAECEAFFIRCGLPFTVGYGMTECGPLISYISYKDFVPTSAGKILPGVMEIKIEREHQSDHIGEIMVRGENVMQGYYKDEEATLAVLDKDGWLKTGDLGTIDASGNIFIRGRSKTMLLGSNGENIYPEAIEAKLINLPLISECMIIQRKKGLEALVYPDYNTAERMQLNLDKLPQIMEDNRKTLNSMVARYETVSSIKIVETPFIKTPKKTVKRYIVEQQYSDAN